jgi:tetratricopeptide (TPR) repeat protein
MSSSGSAGGQNEQAFAASEHPKRAAHAMTYVAAGRLREQEATAPGRSPAEREAAYESARKAYQQALALDTNCLTAYEALAHLYESMGDQDRAVATYQKVLKTHPKEAGLWYDLGMCYSRHKQWDQAVANLSKAVELDPENRPYSHTLGFCLARAGRFDDSLACFQRVDGPAKAHYNLARMLEHLNQTELCKQHLQIAVQADPNLAEAQQLLAQLNGQPATGDRPVINVGFETPAEGTGATP